jgi:hypothetical protein
LLIYSSWWFQFSSFFFIPADFFSSQHCPRQNDEREKKYWRHTQHILLRSVLFVSSFKDFSCYKNEKKTHTPTECQLKNDLKKLPIVTLNLSLFFSLSLFRHRFVFICYSNRLLSISQTYNHSWEQKPWI